MNVSIQLPPAPFRMSRDVGRQAPLRAPRQRQIPSGRGGRRLATLSSPAVGSLIESTKPSALEPLLPYRSDYSFRGKLPPTLYLQSATISLYLSVRKIRFCRSFYNSPNLYPVISIHIFLRLANLIIALVFQAYAHSFHFILQVQYFLSIFVNGCGFSQ